MSRVYELLTVFSKRRLPVILQTELAECGPACLAMIADYHGHGVDIEAVRRRLPTSLKGTTLKDLMALAAQFQLAARPLRLELEHLSNLSRPAILHWNLDHFVVLATVRKDNIVIHDPATGRRVVSMPEVSDSFTGVALELIPTKNFEKKSEIRRVGLSDLWRSIVGLRRSLFQIFLMSAFLQIFALASPFYMQITVDHVLLAGDFHLLNALALGFATLYVIQMLTTTLRSWMVLYLNSTLDIQLATNVLRHLLRLPADYFEKRHLGDVLSRFGSLQKVRDLFTNGLVESVIDGVMTLATLAMMLFYDTKLALIAVAAVSVYAIGRIALFQSNREYTQQALVKAAKEQSTFMETIRAIVPIKLFSKEQERESVWQNLYAASLNSKIRLGRIEILYQAINETALPLASILIVWFGAHSILEGGFSIGMLYAFFSYQNQFTSRAAALVDKLLEFRLVRVDLTRLSDIIHSEQEHFLEQPYQPVRKFTGKLEVRDLFFRYSPGDPYLFANLNLVLEPGEAVAIVGPSGCGKTTLLKILISLLEPERGKVLYDGVEAACLGKKYLRSQLAAVMQDDQLLSGSIAENISFFDPAPDMARLHGCAQIACIAEEILQMPMGYGSLVGDMGTTLSGGQKQRIFLARALYARPRILFLDESSSHLDVETETRINQSLKYNNATRIIIAHRQESIAMADRVIDLSDPSVVSIGLPRPDQMGANSYNKATNHTQPQQA